MEDYSRKRHEEEGYEFVYTPHATKGKLFETSGHLDWYADGMYPPMQLDEGVDYYLKPMNCPMHNLIFDARGRSYRELPLRLFEFGTVYRYEKSGVVHGLTRARGFTQDDAHIYCTREQMAEELDSTLTFVLGPAARLRPDRLLPGAVHQGPGEVRRLGRGLGGGHRDAARRSPRSRACPLVPDPGGAAFYGPKISVQAKDAIGRTWQMSTDPARLQPAGALRPGVHRPGRLQAAPGHDPPRAVRLDRALLRGAAGALRGRVPGRGWRRSRRSASRSATRTSTYLQEFAADGEEAGPAGRGRRLLRPDAEEDPQRPEAEGARSWSSRATRTWRTARSPSATATARRRTASRVDEAIAKIAKVVEDRVQMLRRSLSRSADALVRKAPGVQLPGGLSLVLPCEHLQQPGRERPRHRPEQGQPADHQPHRDQPPQRGHGGDVAVPDRRQRRAGPPHRVPEGHGSSRPGAVCSCVVDGERPGEAEQRSPTGPRRRSPARAGRAGAWPWRRCTSS